MVDHLRVDLIIKTVLVVALSGIFFTILSISLRSKFGIVDLELLPHLQNDVSSNMTMDEVSQDNLLQLTLAEDKYQIHLTQREETKGAMSCPNGRSDGCRQLYFLMTYLSPVYPCYREYHVGAWAEGGKWVCDIPGAISRNNGIVYSIGSNAQVTFEKEIFKLFNTETYTFDPTLDTENLKFMESLDFLKFHEIGLTGEPDLEKAFSSLQKKSPNAKMMNFHQIMNMLHHSYVDILKVDCEGCEESFIRDLLNITSRKNPLFGQLLVEFHRLSDVNLSLPLMDILENLGYRQFHAEPNIYDMKNCWEMAYIHESLLKPKGK